MRLQEWIHKLEVGEGVQTVRWAVAILGLVALGVVYDLRAYKNFSAPEAMDAAQVARNLSEGKGFTTGFIRPLSIHLLEKHAARRGVANADPAMLKVAHPDLANAPLYPTALSGLMRVIPFDYVIPIGANSKFQRFRPEVWIALFNQALFLILLLMVFRLTRRLLDDSVAWISVLIIAGTDLLWRYTVSGLSTTLLQVLFLCLVWCLVVMEQAAREGSGNPRRLLGLALLAGITTGLAGLTRYSFAWMIVPTIVYLVAYFPGRRASLSLVALAGFLVVFTPWLARNQWLSGTPLGTATFSVIQETAHFPNDRLERSLNPDLSEISVMDCVRKMGTGLRTIVQSGFAKLGGNWIGAFFLVGLLVPFMRPGLRRLRVFLLICLVLFSCVQAAARTHGSMDLSDVTNDDLLVVFAPLVFVYGAGMLSLLLNQTELPLPQMRRAIVGIVVLVVSAPLILSLMPRSSPITYPPYYPPFMGRFAGWMKDGELVMSDMPWAVAWYSGRQSVWLTLNVQDAKSGEDFYTFNDLKKPINALYLTNLTSDQQFFTQMLSSQGNGWGRFVVDLAAGSSIPPNFPLKQASTGYGGSGQLFLTDWARWQIKKE